MKRLWHHILNQIWWHRFTKEVHFTQAEIESLKNATESES